MTKETITYSSKPWELSQYFISQWEQKGKLYLPYSDIEVGLAKKDHIPQVVQLVQGNEALVGVGTYQKAEKTIGEFIAEGNGLVAYSGKRIVSFQGMGLWPFGFCELRSARTSPEFEGNGINMTMKKLMIKLAYDKYGWPFIGFTEATSKSRGILRKLGFEELPMSDVESGLMQACPTPEEFVDKQDHCALRCGGDCGCKVYILDINRRVYETQ